MSGTAADFERVRERLRVLLAAYAAPDFAHVPDPDAALFLCAADHKSGYSESHLVDGEGPLRGSALLWAVGLREARRVPGWLTAAGLRQISAERLAEAFEIEDETVVDPQRRARLWRELAAGLERDYGGSAERLLAAADSRLGGERGLLARLARYEAFADPLAKKAQLYAKICERRGWFEVVDPQSWQVSADSVLMRLALRSGLLEPAPLEQLRAATRDVFARLAAELRVSPPLLDDLLWERGREDADLLGREGGDLREPERDPDSSWY